MSGFKEVFYVAGAFFLMLTLLDWIGAASIPGIPSWYVWITLIRDLIITFALFIIGTHEDAIDDIYEYLRQEKEKTSSER